MYSPNSSKAADVNVTEPVTNVVSTLNTIWNGGSGFAGADAESNAKYNESAVISILFSNKFKLPPSNVFVFSTRTGI